MFTSTHYSSIYSGGFSLLNLRNLKFYRGNFSKILKLKKKKHCLDLIFENLCSVAHTSRTVCETFLL